MEVIKLVAIFLQSLLIGYSGAVMPGSLLTYTLDQSLKSGVKAGFMVALGHISLELLLVILIFLGFGQYLNTNLAQIVVGLCGGIVLIFLGSRMIQDIWSGKVAIALPTTAPTENSRMLLGGALISAANPYFTIWWAIVGLGLIMNAFNTFGLSDPPLLPGTYPGRFFLVSIGFLAGQQVKNFHQRQSLPVDHRCFRPLSDRFWSRFFRQLPFTHLPTLNQKTC